MELLDFVKSIGGHIDISASIGDPDGDHLMVTVAKEFNDLRYRPYPGGSGSITGRAKASGNLDADVNAALVDLAEAFNDLDCRQVGFDVQPLFVVPELTHTPGYRPKANKKVKVKS